MAKVTPFLWFDDQAEEAVDFYLSAFPGSRVLDVVRYGDGGRRSPALAGGPLRAAVGAPHPGPARPAPAAGSYASGWGAV